MTYKFPPNILDKIETDDPFVCDFFTAATGHFTQATEMMDKTGKDMAVIAFWHPLALTFVKETYYKKPTGTYGVTVENLGMAGIG